MYFFVFLLLILYSPLVEVGIPVAIIELFICIIAFCLYQKQPKLNINEKIIVLLLFLVSLIDKGNDMMSDFNFISSIGPIVYTLIISIFLSSLRDKKLKLSIKLCYYLSFFSVLIVLFMYLLGQYPNPKAINREVSILFLFYWMINMYYGKRKFIITILVFTINVFFFQARTMIISMIMFYLGYRYMDIITQKQKSFVFLGVIIVGFVIVVAGIMEEFVAGIGNTVFSNHGIIWGVASSEILNTNSLYHFLFGFPTTPQSLKETFSLISDYYDSNPYIANTEGMLERGHFHCSVIYYLYNTGVVGLALMIYTTYKALKLNNFSSESFNMFCAIYVVAIFNGISLTGIYTISTIFLISILTKLPAKGSFKL